MTLSKGAIGNLVNRYRAVLKKCHLMNAFGSLAVAGILVMGAVNASAEGSSIIINSSDTSPTTSYSYTQDATITGDKQFSADKNAIVGIANGKSNTDMQFDVASGKCLTVNASASSDRAYAVAVTNGASLTFKGNGKFTAAGTMPETNSNATSGQARAIRNNGGGTLSFDGDIAISAESKNEFTAGVDTWSNANADTSTIFKGTKTTINVKGGQKVNALQVVSNTGYKADALFAADSTVIENESKKYNGDNWANVAVVEGEKATLTFSGKTAELTSKNTDYTAQVISLVTNGNVVFSGEKAKLTAKSNFGANGIGGTGDILFSGKEATIDAIVTDGVGATNAVGILTGTKLEATNAVESLNINVYGSGAWNGNSGYANGTAGIFSSGGTSALNAKNVNINVTAGQSVEDKGITFKKTDADAVKDKAGKSIYSTAYGIRMYSGTLSGGADTATTINVSEGYKDAVGLSVESSSTDSNGFTAFLLGNSTIKVNGATDASAVRVSGGKVTLGSTDKNITLSSSTTGGVSKTVEATNGAEITFAGNKTTISNKSTTKLQNYGVYLDGATANFGATTTDIKVEGVGQGDVWGYGIDLHDKSTASFTGKDVSISDYQKDYTAQTVTVRGASQLTFSNTGNVDVTAKSPFGSTALVVKVGDDAKMTFDNTGDVTVTSTVEDPATFATTNVVGLMIEKGTASFTNKVNNANFNIFGQGWDYTGNSASDGTVALFVQKKAEAKIGKLDVQAQNLNINVDANVDPNKTPVDTELSHNDAYGIRNIAGEVSVGSGTNTKIVVNESRGTAYGVAAVGDASTVEILGNTDITATWTGEQAANALSTTETGDTSGTSEQKKVHAYALFADKAGTITLGSAGKTVALKSSDTGIFVGGAAAVASNGDVTGSTSEPNKKAQVALNGNMTITAPIALAGSGLITNAGTLNVDGLVSGFTGEFSQSGGLTTLSRSNDFFGGKVTLTGGTLNAQNVALVESQNVNIKSATMNVASLNLTHGKVEVGTLGNLVVKPYGDVTFSDNNTGALTIDGGKVTADASKFFDSNFTVLDNVAAGVVGSSGELYLRFNEYTPYTDADLQKVKEALFGTDENAKVGILNGPLIVPDTPVTPEEPKPEEPVTPDQPVTPEEPVKPEEPGEHHEQLVVGGEATESGKISLDNVVPVVTKGDETASDANTQVPLVPENVVSLVDKSDPNKALLSINELEVTNSSFAAKALQAEPQDAAQGVTLNIGDGSDITLVGGDTESSSLIVDTQKNPVATNVSISGGGTLNLGISGNVGQQMVALSDVGVASGTLNVNGNGLDTTRHSYKTLSLSQPEGNVNLNNASVVAQKAALAQGSLNVLNAEAHFENLEAAGGTLFVDPAYLKVANLAGDTFGSNLLVGNGSVVEIGSIAELRSKAMEVGLNPMAFGSGFVLADGQSMLALGKPVKLGQGGRIVVDAGVKRDGTINGAAVGDSAYFGSGSLLVVDSSIANGSGAITGNGGVITVRDGAGLYLTDAVVDSTYVVATGFADASSTVAGWTGSDLFTNRMIHAERIAGTDGSVIVKTSAKKRQFDATIPHLLDTIMDSGMNDVDSGNKGIAFLSRALEPQFLEDRDVAPTLDGAAQLAYAGGVQASTITVAQAPVRAIQDHLSLAGHVAQQETSLREDGFDLWANALYGANRARDFSAGGLEAGYNSDFAGGVIGGDWTFGAGAGKGRIGLAFNVGSGDTRSRGDFNSTKNDFDFWGVSLYGGWNMDNVNVIADLGYSASKNELKQDIPSSMELGGRIKGDVDSSVITAGVKAEYMVKTDVLDVMPHVGVRYMAVKTDSFTTKLDMGGDLFHTDSDLQHVWQFPVGVNLSKSFETESGWKIKPQADLSVVPAAGDTKTKIDVRTPGVNASDSMKRRVMDTTSFDGVFGVEVQKDNVSFSLGYNVQASEHQTGQGVTASFMYKF